MVPSMGIAALENHSDSLVCDVRGRADACAYIASHCDGYFDIARLYYCSSHASSPLYTAAFYVAILLCLLVLFGCLSLIVATHFFPNVNYFTRACGWNNRILSVMLLPLTNALPDMVSYYVTLSAGSVDLVLGQLIGSILVMLTVIIGTIAFLCPFTIADSRWVMRDFVWVVAVLVMFLYILSDGKITAAECMVMVVLFVVYLLYLSHWDLNLLPAEQQKDREYARELAHLPPLLPVLQVLRLPLPLFSSPPLAQHAPQHVLQPLLDPRDMRVSRTHSATSIESTRSAASAAPSIKSAISALSARSVAAHSGCSDGPVFDEVVELLEHRDNRPHRLWRIVHYAIDLLEHAFALVIPVVEDAGFDTILQPEEWRFDVDELLEVPQKTPPNPWKRLWFAFVVLLLSNQVFGLTTWSNMVPVILISMIVTEAVSQYCHFNKVAASIVGVYTAMLVISQISQGVLRLLKNFGVLLQISDYMLGLLVFSLSNSITDIITNITISVTVDPIYGVNCLLGSPIILILLGIGVNGLIVQAAGHKLKFRVHDNLVVSAGGVVLVMLLYLAYIPLNHWRLDRKLGVAVWACAVVITAVNWWLE